MIESSNTPIIPTTSGISFSSNTLFAKSKDSVDDLLEEVGVGAGDVYHLFVFPSVSFLLGFLAASFAKEFFCFDSPLMLSFFLGLIFVSVNFNEILARIQVIFVL